MKYGHLPNGAGLWLIIRSDDGAAWTMIGSAFTEETAQLAVEALNEHDAVHALRTDLEAH